MRGKRERDESSPSTFEGGPDASLLNYSDFTLSLVNRTCSIFLVPETILFRKNYLLVWVFST